MRLLALALAISAGTVAHAAPFTSLNEIYFTENMQCEVGRLVTQFELQSIRNYCNKLTWETGAYKVQNSWNPEQDRWFLTQTLSDSCSFTSKALDWGTPKLGALCYAETPEETEVYAFGHKNYGSLTPLKAKPVVMTAGNKYPTGEFLSFKVGSNAYVEAYSEENLQGQKVVLKSDMDVAPFVIKSVTVELRSVPTTPLDPAKTGNNHSYWMSDADEHGSCGTYGRMVQKSELDKTAKLCEGVPEINGYWKFVDADGSFWNMAGPPASQCDLIPGSSADVPSLCTYNGVNPAQGQVMLFPAPEFKGNTPWGGKPVIAEIDDAVVDGSVGSFKVGDDVNLVVKGKDDQTYIYTPGSVVESLSYEVESYEVVSVFNGKVAFDFDSLKEEEGGAFSCLKLKANGKTEEICSNDSEVRESKLLTDLPKGDGTMAINITLNDYDASGNYPYPTQGELHINHKADGTFKIGSIAHMPDGLTVEQLHKNILSFTRN